MLAIKWVSIGNKNLLKHVLTVQQPSSPKTETERKFNATTALNISAGPATHYGQVKDPIFAKDQHVNLSALKLPNRHGQDRFSCIIFHKH